MHRFFIPPEEIHPGHAYIKGKTARQMARVLRLKPGTECVLLDNLGSEYLARLDVVDVDNCGAEIMEKRQADEPGVRLLMMLCLTQREKFEWMLQKCTEIGAAGFLPVVSQRSLVQHEDDVRNKVERWQDILREAAEQSGRGKIPVLHQAIKFDAAVQMVEPDYPLRLITWEGEKAVGLKGVLKSGAYKQVSVLIGPEGGFAEAEVQGAVRQGFQPVTLGKRILRMETAAVVSAALVLHELE
jgi:16S rRNA (uracil1498-N3)-methyltransferase